MPTSAWLHGPVGMVEQLELDHVREVQRRRAQQGAIPEDESHIDAADS